MDHLPVASMFVQEASVRSYECGADGRMKPEVLLHWFQEIAQTHASSLGFGYECVSSRNMAWVEIRMDIAITRWPLWRETLTLQTCTTQASPLQARRNLQVDDSSGQPIIKATCLWTVLDTLNRKPLPLIKCFPDFPVNPSCTASVTPISMDVSTLVPETRAWTATCRDLDFNRHINNSAYLIWALEDLSLNWLDQHELQGIHLYFRKESHAGEQLHSLLFQDGLLTCHHIGQDQEIRAQAILEWSGRTSL